MKSASPKQSVPPRSVSPRAARRSDTRAKEETRERNSAREYAGKTAASLGSSPSTPSLSRSASTDPLPSGPTRDLKTLKENIIKIDKASNSLKQRKDVLDEIKAELEIIKERLTNLRERGNGKVPRSGYTDKAQIQSLLDALNDIEGSDELKGTTEISDIKRILRSIRSKLSISGGTRRKRKRTRPSRRKYL